MRRTLVLAVLASWNVRHAQAVWCDCEQLEESEYSSDDDGIGSPGICDLSDYATDTTWISCHDVVDFPDLEAYTALEDLSIRDSWLDSVPESISQLTNLKSLDLSSNHLVALPASIKKLKTLTRLNLKSNELNVIPEEISALSNLRKLNMQSNKLTALPSSLGGLRLLTRLVVSYNSDLSSLPSSIKQLSKLARLEVESCGLESLPESISALTSLTSLHVGSNKLAALPSGFTALTKLRELDLWDNDLVSLPEKIHRLSALEYADFEGNELSSLPTELVKLLSLTDLFLANNLLADLPSSFGSLESMEYLDVSSNLLTQLPDSFTALKSLRWLRVEGNPFCGPQPDLSDLDFEFVEGGDDFKNPELCDGTTAAPTTLRPTLSPTEMPTPRPTPSPSESPTAAPTTLNPTQAPTLECSPSDVVLMMDASLQDFEHAQNIAKAIASGLEIGKDASQDRFTAFNFADDVVKSKPLPKVKNYKKAQQLISSMKHSTEWDANLPFAFSHAVGLHDSNKRSTSATRVVVILTQGTSSVSNPTSELVFDVCSEIDSIADATTEALHECLMDAVAEAAETDGLVVIYVPLGDATREPQGALSSYLQVPDVDDTDDVDTLAAEILDMVQEQCAHPTPAPTLSPVVATEGCYSRDVEFRGSKIKMPSKKTFTSGVANAGESNAVDFYNELSFLYGYVVDDAERFVRPGEGFPPNVEYRWPVGGGKTLRLSSPEYVEYAFTWMEDTIDNEEIFPVSVEQDFPDEFVDVYARKMFKLMFRIFAILFHQHFETIEVLGGAAHMNTCFKHFVFFMLEHDLVPDEQEILAARSVFERYRKQYEESAP
ncbi:Leucine-rich repeat-containing protein 1 [Hondaea fermentalgiana]|uniref:Leucine-rich repeat-containing protein 1 n=1 Tax=Hondaea fermentalgiana TaxID=2315210 RepID=A0A2R5GDJ1_9STRA|nr:Leucine-rich repeat-containing protein 1 [Hondaea fermentalgiana]|eukprot:GBG27788.1 Leucine-rich repeat-containing protein 1 [Hondaea fermentalgiana]